MSIKKLFDSGDKNRNYLTDSDQKTTFSKVESNKNIEQISQKQNDFVPQIDFSEPENFAKYGSAYLYYKGAIEHIYDYYPYDGSDAEINKFYNELLDVEKYIFNNDYPRTNGYAHMCPDGWGTLNGTISNGYGLPNNLEYITFFGGPNTSSYTNLADAFSNPTDTKYQHSNLYDTDVYTSAGEPSDYGTGTRQSNLQSNFNTGVTVEFWLQKDTFATSLTEKEVVFDMWNNNASGSHNYGRIRVELDGTAGASPFLITALSGTGENAGIYQQIIGTGITTSTLTSFGHYAVVYYNDGSDFITKLYVNGVLNDTNATTSLTIGELESKGMVGRLGALLAPGASPSGNQGQEYAGKLTGSLDEFRFWKARRDSKEIADNYNIQVRGGSNSDISNTTLGVYFKFNEGITADSSIDSTVLDYSGRISNGIWTGYGTNSRDTGSAMVLASAATSEYLDPIIYSAHPSVSSLESSLLTKGENYDTQNNNAFINLSPSWLLSDSESTTSNLRVLSHIMGTYLDKLYLQISSLTDFKKLNYTSASYTPLPFAQHLPQSLGLFTPDIFIDSNITERFLNRSAIGDMESDLTETKNLIYLNLYNNLSNIYKAKGTEKSVRNIFRCFNIDDDVIKLKTYANNQIFELKNNLKLTLAPNSYVNNNSLGNLEGVVYQKADSTNAESKGFIVGTNDSNKEERYGFTAEANIIFPAFKTEYDNFSRAFTTASLFGMNEANALTPDNTTWLSTDDANFQVFACRDAPNSKNVYFKLTSSNDPYPLPLLTSSVFLDTYDNQEWNFSVRMKPSNYPLSNLVTGSSTFTYTLEFQGINAVGDTIQNSFFLTSSVSQAGGAKFLKSAKRVYTGARRTNVTGAILQKSDVLITNVKYWTKYLDDISLRQHLYDTNNAGVSGSYKNLSPLDPNLSQTNTTNLNTLALHWTFSNITASDSSGEFYYVTDQSSGSALLRNNYGWVGGISGYQHTGYGYGYDVSSTNVVKTENHNTLKFVDPEAPTSSDMINVLSDSDRLYNLSKDKPEYIHIIEKSMYNAISEEMLGFFAGIVDFNNIIGEPVHRYRHEYKGLIKLREIFFRKVTTVSKVEKFIEYYKWLDDALAQIVAQMLPASDGVVDDAYNIIEGHVLERNKYRTQFPTIEFKSTEPETPIRGIGEKLLNWRLNHAPINLLERENCSWWNERAERSTSTITSGDSTVDSQREAIRETANIINNQTSSTLVDPIGTAYEGSVDVLRRHSAPYRLEVLYTKNRNIGGGVNFTDTKSIQFTHNALAPAGPVAHPGGAFIPQNILIAYTGEATDLKDCVDVTVPNQKIKRYFKVNHGRDYFDGGEYSHVKSSFAFPFNIISGAVGSGHNKYLVQEVNLNIDIVNLHNDVYGPFMEMPMQGPFTNYAVGGHQSRHVALNTGSDDYTNRPEAWKILLGSDAIVGGITGAIGMVGADYPWPEANAVGVRPYPMTASQKAVYYRDHVAKRPVNIRNIHQKTGSTILGNYRKNYEVVHTFGGFSNPRGFVENPPDLPTQVTQAPSSSQGRTILSNRRTDESHFEFTPPYLISYMTSAAGKSVIRTRFSAPGGIETIGQGYGDIRSNDYSVYNALNYKNLTVLRPFQNMSGSTSEAVGVGTPGIRVSDIHGSDFGLRAHLTRHAGRFGRDSTLVASPGASIDESPALNKINRNPAYRLIDEGGDTIRTRGQYDNFFVQHQIPRADRQYAWITSSLSPGALTSSNIRYWGYAPLFGPQAGYYSSSATGYTAYFDFVTGSSVLGNSGTASIYQPALDLNFYVTDPVDDLSDNVLGQGLAVANSTYLNTDLLGVYEINTDLNSNTDVFNLLMTKRKNTFGYRCVPLNGPVAHPIIRRQRRQNILSYEEGGSISRATVKPVTYRGSPALINIDIQGQNTTLRTSYSNEFIYFSDDTLNEKFLSPDRINKQTSFNKIVDLAKSTSGYNLNWVLYSESLFPSAINDFTTGSSQRTSYDNLYWRDQQSSRVTLHSSSILTNSYGVATQQSCWPLDAPSDFLTRGFADLPTINQSVADLLRLSNSAGELQNEYIHAIFGTVAHATMGRRIQSVALGGLYARKHMLGGARSVSSPSGVPIPETGSHKFPPIFTDIIDLYAGESLWEAATQAGIIEKSGLTDTFTSKPSEPWFDSYTDYIEDVLLVNRGFAIVPEFRISEHISDYSKFGIDANNKFDTFEIVGTSDNSSNSGFYRDFSNSEFMESFADISEETSLGPAEIKLTCAATLRLNPYKGFYPAQRTLDLVKQFSDSYKTSVIGESAAAATPGATDGGARPIAQALFAPGILYNTIKSGIAVDYPIASAADKFELRHYGEAITSSANVAWMINAVTSSGKNNYTGGEFWDDRIPFEAIIDPETHISNLTLYDMEPHPSASLTATGSFMPIDSDVVYKKMASNFFGEIGNFFLKGESYTRLVSNTVTSDLRFESGSIYGARIKIRRSLSGSRTYDFESGSTGNNEPYSRYGGKFFDTSNNEFADGYFPIPQDPKQNPGLQESFTLYSRPTAFGPAISGRPYAETARSSSVTASHPVDSVAGFNWAYTPPYYNGEAWLDLVFTPSADTTYDLEKILSEVSTKYWRCDPGISASATSSGTATGFPNTQLIPTFSGNIASVGDLIYEGSNVNDNAMQLKASINAFGIERVSRERTDQFGNKISSENETVGKKWVIQPKMETPMLNFSNQGTHPITNADGNLSLPTYSSASVSRGMWHQFGVIEPDSTKGIFLEIGAIPTGWLKYHYEVRSNDSIYNKNSASNNGLNTFRNMKPLTDVVKFDVNNSSKRLGELKESMTIKEAIVAVPYTHVVSKNAGKTPRAESKEFFGIDKGKISDAKSERIGSTGGDSLDNAGESIRDLVSKMGQYVFPPQFDFVNNTDVDPMVMYVFEFEYTFDKDDLSYIWQNIAPRNYKKITKQTASTAHVLGDNQLLSKDDVTNEDTRWMVFKVKQRSQVEYEDLLISQVGESTKPTKNGLFDSKTEEEGYKLNFNWPYDYVSFVETIKFGAEVLYKNEDE